jgi:hypothetical protein
MSKILVVLLIYHVKKPIELILLHPTIIVLE